jgi:hypothetical protein
MTTTLERGEGLASRLGLYLPPVPIAQEAGWAPVPVWTGAENIASTGIRSLDRPARSQSLFQPIMASVRTHNFIPRNFLNTRSDLKKNSTTQHKQTKLPVLVPDTRRNFRYVIQEKDYKSCFDEGKLVMSFL